MILEDKDLLKLIMPFWNGCKFRAVLSQGGLKHIGFEVGCYLINATLLCNPAAAELYERTQKSDNGIVWFKRSKLKEKILKLNLSNVKQASAVTHSCGLVFDSSYEAK